MSKFGKTNYYKVYVNDEDVSFDNIDNIPALETALASAETFDSGSVDKECGFDFAAGENETSEGEKSSKVTCTIVLKGLNQEDKTKAIGMNGQRKCVILLDKRTGEVQKGGLLLCQFSGEAKSNKKSFITLVFEEDDFIDEIYTSKTLALT